MRLRNVVSKPLLLPVILLVLSAVGLLTYYAMGVPHSTFPEEKAKVNTVVTKDISDLPQHLQETAERAESMIIDSVGQDIYDEHYRIATEKSIECSSVKANPEGCVAFIYLPPTEHGLSDRFLFARYIEGELAIVGTVEDCLTNPDTCLFNVDREEALAIINDNGYQKELEDLRLEDSSKQAKWWWQTYAPGPDHPDPHCDYATVVRVDVAFGALSTENFESCA